MKNMDYYSVLGISRDASKDDIQRAYRKGARKYHPDVNKGGEAEARFKEINEANDVLKDPRKRKLYDIYGEHWAQAHEQGLTGEENRRGFDTGGNYSDSYHSVHTDGTYHQEDIKDFFANLFGAGMKNGGYGNAEGPVFNSGPEVYEAEITLSLNDILHAETKTISFMVQEYNPETGKNEMEEKKIKVRIPKGVSDGSIIRIKNFDKNHSPATQADLLLKIRIIADSRFRIDGHNLLTTVSLSPWEAALGAKVMVQTIDGTVSLTVPSGTLAGKRFRLKGKGLPGRNGRDGDIIVETIIQIPASLSDEEKDLFRELSEKSAYNPRSQEEQRAGVSEKM